MSVILAMCLFSLSMSISPGPVNLITLSTGVNHGVRSAMPFVAGATVGFSILLLFIGLGVGQVAAENTELMAILGYIGSGFICYMGYKIATSDGDVEIKRQNRPTFLQGAALQLLNPKAWIACLAGVSAFNLSASYEALMVFSILYFVICYASVSSWAVLGSRISKYISEERKLQVFNQMMGAVLILISIYLLYMQSYYA
ncbi:LysE family translocator [Pontibacterium sp.]|uniref:LysE family translocator n=1 Tax=Pontibacterium sp. TaxID=2036026 RepID=UPI0035150188